MLLASGAVGAYLAWGSELARFRESRIVLGALILAVMLAALYGIVVHFKCPEQVLWTERYSVYEGRLMSTYICPNHFAHLMQMLLPFCLALLFIPQAGIYLKVLAGYSFLVFLPTLFLTESRAGWLGAIAATGVMVCLMALRKSKRLFLLLAILVPVCSALLLLGAWRYSETFQRRMQPVVTFLEGQAEEGIGSEARDFRPQTWMDTIDMIKDAPLYGHGAGNYRYTYPEYRKRFKGNRFVSGHPHNEYLELVADHGLVGFGLFALAWIYGLGWVLVGSLKAEKTRHAYMGFAFLGAAAGTMVHSFFDFQMHEYPNALVFAFLAAVAVGPLRNAKRGSLKSKNVKGVEDALEYDGTPLSLPSGLVGHEPPSRSGSQQPARRIKRSTFNVQRIFVTMIGAAYLVGTAFCIQIMSSAYIRVLGDKAAGTKHSALSTKHGQVTKHPAAKYYELATKIDPQNWRAYKGMARLSHDQWYYTLDREEKLRFAMVKKEWYEKAYRHNAYDPEIVAGLGKTLLFLGRARGLELLREACRHRKFHDLYWWTLGVELRKAGMHEEALEVFHHAEKLKRTPSTRMNIQWLERQMSENGLSDVESLKPEDTKERLVEGGAIDLEGMFQSDSKRDAEKDSDLSDLLDIMEN
ncbi:MAG: O-antigen ligase family protein [Verrucomicrobiota bacterium]